MFDVRAEVSRNDAVGKSLSPSLSLFGKGKGEKLRRSDAFTKTWRGGCYFGLDQTMEAFLKVLARTFPCESRSSTSTVSALMTCVGLLEFSSTLISTNCSERPA